MKVPTNTIQALIVSLHNEGLAYDKISYLLGCSASMVSRYKNEDFNPSIDVAIQAYINLDKVLHPYSEEGLKFEAEFRGVHNDT